MTQKELLALDGVFPRGDRRGSGVDARWRWICLTLGTVAVAFSWFRWLTASFWLDETGTAWVVRNGFHEVITGSKLQGQTPLYYVIAWIARVFGGSSEWALRVPSVVSALVATFLLFRLCRRLFDEEIAWIAAVLFVASVPIAFAATDARPYALGLAILLGSALALVRWFDEGRKFDLLAWGILGALVVFTAFTMALGLIAQIPYAVYRVVKEKRRSLLWLVLGGAVAVMLSVPALVQLVSLLQKRDILLWLSLSPSWRQFGAALVSVAALWGVMVGVLLSRLRGPISWKPVRTSSLALVVPWWLLPTCLLFLLGWLVAPKFFQSRYYIAAAPGTTLVLAWFVGSFRDRVTRLIILGCVVVALVVSFDGSYHRQDWREAAHKVNSLVTRPSTPVLVNSGFSSGSSVLGTSVSGLVMAPVSAYPLKGEIIYLPLDLDRADRVRLDLLVRDLLAKQRRFVLVTTFHRWPIRELLETRLAPLGFTSSTQSESLYLQVVLFERA